MHVCALEADWCLQPVLCLAHVFLFFLFFRSMAGGKYNNDFDIILLRFSPPASAIAAAIV